MPSQRQRIAVMVALLALFMAGLAVMNAVDELAGTALCAAAVLLSALYVVRLNRRR